jgi:hypothetical protein
MTVLWTFVMMLVVNCYQVEYLSNKICYFSLLVFCLDHWHKKNTIKSILIPLCNNKICKRLRGVNTFWRYRTWDQSYNNNTFFKENNLFLEHNHLCFISTSHTPLVLYKNTPVIWTHVILYDYISAPQLHFHIHHPSKTANIFVQWNGL